MEVSNLLLDEPCIYIDFLKNNTQSTLALHFYTYSRNIRGVRKGIIVTDEERETDIVIRMLFFASWVEGGLHKKDKTNKWWDYQSTFKYHGNYLRGNECLVVVEWTKQKKLIIFFSSQLLLFSQSTIDITTYDDDFDVCIHSNCTKICYWRWWHEEQKVITC